VHDNGFGGIAVLDGSGPTSVYVTNNRVFNNSTATNGYGIAASGPVTLVSGNTVTGQSGSGAYGIQASFGATPMARRRSPTIESIPTTKASFHPATTATPSFRAI